jgi:hypothetical protein
LIFRFDGGGCDGAGFGSLGAIGESVVFLDHFNDLPILAGAAKSFVRSPRCCCCVCSKMSRFFPLSRKPQGYKDQPGSNDPRRPGRIETRTYTVSHDVAWLQRRHDWPGLKAVVMRSGTRFFRGDVVS